MQAARIMHDRDTGDVVVTDSRGRVSGILTDRDIVTRVIASGRDPALTAIGNVLTPTPVTVQPDTEASMAVALMREHAVRWILIDRTYAAPQDVGLGDARPTGPACGRFELLEWTGAVEPVRPARAEALAGA